MADVTGGGGVSARFAATDAFMEERIMAWMSKSDAAIALGLSPLVLSRKIAVGKFSAKSVGGRVLVDVPDGRDNGAETTESHEDRAGDVNANTTSADIRNPVTAPIEDEEHTDISPCESKARGTDVPEVEVTDDAENAVEPEAQPHPGRAMDESCDVGSVAAALDAVDRVRVLCDQDAAFAREDADRAWRSVERTERRLRQVAWVAASALLIAVIGISWQDRSHANMSRISAARVAELETVVATAKSREGGEIDALRATVSTLREDAALARERAAEVGDGLQAQLTDAGAELAAMRVELDHVCWERDEAMRLRDRLKNEVAGQREHIEKMQSMQANLAARTLQRLIDESWDVKPDTSSVVQEKAESGDKSVTTRQASRQ
ncbi:MAG: hypothetical protein IID42_11820 [Planctomycetes bacterium]|nr:hypothetical protein [Planctomycetota bacterium]